MVDYTTSLFDLAMIAFPIEDTKNLVNLVVGSFTGPVGALDALNAVLNLARQALKYGRIIGALYRDTLELEVQVWLDSPGEDQATIPDPYKITDKTVLALRAVYDRKNDDVVAWEREIAVLRAQGLEPLPSRKYFYEIGALIRYLCGLVVSSSTDNKSPYAICMNGLVLEPTTKAISAGSPVPVIPPVAGTKQGAVHATRPLPGFHFLSRSQPQAVSWQDNPERRQAPPTSAPLSGPPNSDVRRVPKSQIGWAAICCSNNSLTRSGA
jgi:molybdopterin converting factor small subunit